MRATLPPGRDRACRTFLSGHTNYQYFSPPEDTAHHEGATHRQSVPCRPNATGTTGPDPTRPPRPNASDNRTGRPLGGEDDDDDQQHNNLTCGHAANRRTTTKHARQETNDVGDSLQRPNSAGQAHTGNRTTPDKPTTGGQDDGEPTQSAGHAPVAPQPPHRTGRPQRTSELTGKTTKTTSGYISAGCSAIDPTTHKPTIRRLTQPGTNQTAAEKTTRQ